MFAPVLILVTRPLLGTPSEGSRSLPTPSDPGYRPADADEPQLSVRDLGVTRADGVFETVMVSRGTAPALDSHLERLQASAGMLEFPALDPEVWRRAFEAAVTAHPPVALLAVKLVLTRGVEGTGVPTAWALAQPAPDFAELRVTGLRAVTLDRGYRHDVAATAPWLLRGAKTLSYEINAAALREARRRDAEDAIFVSSDGFVLEATTSTVLVRQQGRFTTPASELGVVPGTTVRRAFALLEERGHETSAPRTRAAELDRADGLWLLSSIRRAVPVTRLDGRELPVDPELTAALNEHLGAGA
ncbi:MAG: aminotransferase class IV [Herbiconiux sp.]|nr:aminotransferase class IV [Herbiconiux sp.]